MQLKLLSDEQLEKLNTKRLLGVLKFARAVESAEQSRLSEKADGILTGGCDKWQGTDVEYDELVRKPTAYLTIYKNKIKAILATREDVK